MSLERNGGIFRQAFDLLKEYEPSANTEKFSQLSALSLDILLENKKLSYVATKKSFNEDQFKSKSNSTLITTPHPIGNLSAFQCLMLDVISQLSNVSARRNVTGKYGNSYGLKIKEYLSTAKSQLATLNGSKTQAFEIITGEFSKSGDINVLQVSLAKMVLEAGIPTKVITAEEQLNSAIVRDERIKSADPKNPIQVKTWNLVDGDGDAKNPMSNIITWGKGKNILEIYNSKPDTSQKTIVEPRLSCADKKGVTGIITHLKTIEGAKDIKSWENLFDKNTYDAAYAKYKTYLENQKYAGDINQPLELILRVAAPAFIKAEGFVLSDFDSKQTHVMPALRFILQATEQYLSEKTKKHISIKQTIMPLCESKQSIEGAASLFAGYLSSVSKAIHADCAAQVTKEQKKYWINKMVFPAGNTPFYGAFYGPSDLTKDMGGQSINYIASSIEELNKAWQSFMQKEATFFGKDFPQIKIEFGKGTSPKRGGGFTLPYSPTVQGSNFVTWDTSRIKASSRVMRAQNENSSGSVVDKKFIEGAVAFHEKLLGENGGAIVETFDELRNGPILSVLTARYSNNQGTRGNGENPPFKEQRAIASAATTALIGLLSAPGFPESLIGYDYDVMKAVKNPADLHILVSDLYQIAGLDFKRATSLGFGGHVKICRQYADNVLGHIAKQVGAKYISPKDDNFANAVGDVVAAIASKTNDKTAQIVLKQFKEQLPLIQELKNTLTITVKQPPSEQIKANAAFVNSLMANFQLPLIPANGYKKNFVNDNKDRKVWAELINNEQRQKAYNAEYSRAKL